MHAAELLSHRARLSPDKEALYELNSDRRYSYAQLDERANRLANLLQGELGVEKGDRVSILAHNCVAYLDLLYGAAKIGAIMAPLNWRLALDELIYILRDCDPKVLVCGPEFINMLNELRSRLTVPHIIVLEDAELAQTLNYENALAEASSQEPRRPPLEARDPYCIFYTSGTTGRPKGAVLPHRQVLWNCINTTISWRLTDEDVSPVFLPLFHVGGLFAFMTPILYAGGRIVLARDFDADESLRVIEQERCTVILGVPTVFRLWMDAPAFNKADFSHVRWFISGGAPCPVTLMETWRITKGVVFRQGYGLTEVGPNCFSMSDDDSLAKSGSVGKPIFHTQAHVVDSKHRQLPVGEVGELVIAGPHVCRGYWRDQTATAAAIVDGWFHTGDMARRDTDGFFYVMGRYKDMLISGGENVYAAEVESVFLGHPDVAEAALIAQPDDKLGEVGLMVVVPQAGSRPTSQALLKVCEGRLARYKIPKRVVFADELPHSPYGKVQKDVLKKKYLS